MTVRESKSLPTKDPLSDILSPLFAPLKDHTVLTSIFPPTRASRGGNGLSLSFRRPLRLGLRGAVSRNDG